MLTPDSTRYDLGVRVNVKLIPDSARASKYVASYVQQGQSIKPCAPLVGGCRGVTIHNTNDLPRVEDDPEQYTRATWPNCNMGGIVVHYYVDDLGAWQLLREDERGWHAADGDGMGNASTVAVEVIMDGETGEANQKAEDNAARLTAAILHRHGLGTGDVYTHQHWYPRKTCPVYILPHWNAYIAKVQQYLDELQVPAAPEGYISLAEHQAAIDELEARHRQKYTDLEACTQAMRARVQICEQQIHDAWAQFDKGAHG